MYFSEKLIVLITFSLAHNYVVFIYFYDKMQNKLSMVHEQYISPKHLYIYMRHTGNHYQPLVEKSGSNTSCRFLYDKDSLKEYRNQEFFFDGLFV